MQIQLHYYESQVALVQYFSKSLNFSRVCHKPVWLTNVSSAVVPSDNFRGFLIDCAKLIYTELLFVSLQQAAYSSSRLLIIIFKNVNRVN